jgi:hypothetical protein
VRIDGRDAGSEGDTLPQSEFTLHFNVLGIESVLLPDGTTASGFGWDFVNGKPA